MRKLMEWLSAKLGFQRRSVFMMVLSLFVLITLPIYLLGFGIYNWGYQTIEQEITGSLRADLRYYMGILEREVERVRTLQYECLNDEDLFYTVNAESIMSPYERTKALLTMQHRLGVMRQSSAYIEDVRVYLPKTGRVISAQRGVEKLTDEWRDILYAPEDDAPSRLTYVDGQMYLCASYPIIAPDESVPPLYTLIIKLSPGEIRSLLLSFNDYQDGGAALYAASPGFLLTFDPNDTQMAELVRDQNVLTALREGKAETLSLNGKNYMVVGDSSAYLGMLFLSYVSQESVFGGLWYYRTLFVIFLAVMLAVAAAFSAGSYYLIRQPMKKLIDSLKRLEKGEFGVRIRHGINDEYAYLYDTFNSMAEALQNLIELNYKQQLLTQQAEMRQLQTQINPHFLYNGFFTLYRMAKDEDYDSMTEFLVYLSDYYRYITRDARAEVALRDEVKHAENYAHIQQIRFGRRIRVEMEPLPERAQALRVPRLILQPVLENAFGHGLKDVTENGLLTVTYRVEEPYLLIRVENNGLVVSEEKLAELRASLDDERDLKEITGMTNIHRRLRLKFGANCGLSLSHGEQGGLCVTLRLKLGGL